MAFVIPAPVTTTATSSPARSSRRAPSNLASFKVPRAVYFVEEFPTGTLDKILKNKLREMADDQPAVD